MDYDQICMDHYYANDAINGVIEIINANDSQLYQVSVECIMRARSTKVPTLKEIFVKYCETSDPSVAAMMRMSNSTTRPATLFADVTRQSNWSPECRDTCHTSSIDSTRAQESTNEDGGTTKGVWRE